MLKLLNLMPREDAFFTLLLELAEQAHKSARKLKIFIESPDAAAKAEAGEILKGCRVQAKAISIEITRKLCQTYITPFDREDIQDLASDIYRIPKIIEKIYSRILLHDIGQLHGNFSRQVDLIVQEADAMKAMMEALTSKRGAGEILKYVTLLRDLENKGDDVLSDLLQSLFRDVSDARTLILLKDIYDMLEKAIDCHRDAASVALQIVLKHS